MPTTDSPALASLPAEVIGIVARFVEPKSPRDSISLSSINSHWRGAVVGDAHLWTDIRLRLSQHNHELLQLTLERAGQVPFAVDITFMEVFEDEDVYATSSSLLRERAERINHMTLFFDNLLSLQFDLLTSGYEFPSLRSLSLSLFAGVLLDLRMVAPRLEKLEIDGTRDPFLGWPSLVMPCTTSLSIKCRVSVATFRDFIRTNPPLVHLQSMGFTDTEPDQQWGATARTLPSLTSVVIAEHSLWMTRDCVLALDPVRHLTVVDVWPDSVSYVLPLIWPAGASLVSLSISDDWEIDLGGSEGVNRSIRLEPSIDIMGTYVPALEAVEQQFQNIDDLSSVRLPLDLWSAFVEEFVDKLPPPQKALRVELLVRSDIDHFMSSPDAIADLPTISDLVISAVPGMEHWMDYETVLEIARSFTTPAADARISVHGLTLWHHAAPSDNDTSFMTAMLQHDGLKNWRCVEIAP